MSKDTGAMKSMVIFITCNNHSANRNLAHVGDVCWAHHWYRAGRKKSRTNANHTTLRTPKVGFALGKDDPVSERSSLYEEYPLFYN